MSFTAGAVMDRAAALLNDSAKTLYSYAVQVPYLKIAMDELEQELLLNEVTLQLKASITIPVLAGAQTITLPVDFFLPIKIFERRTGSTSEDDFFPMTEVQKLTLRPQTTVLGEWTFRDESLQLIGATQNRDIRLEYWRTLPAVVDSSSTVTAAGAINSLAYRTASLCAQYIGRQIERAAELRSDAGNALDTLTSVYVKNSQGKRVRRKPWRPRQFNA